MADVMNSPTALLEQKTAARTDDAVKIYGKGQTEVRALDGVSVEFGSGRYTAVMGPSGSGKSTLLHCVAGLDNLTSGRAFIGDVDLSTLNDQRLTILAAGPRRLRVPGLQPGADDQRREEHHPAAAAGRPQGRPGVDQPGHPDRRLADRLQHRPSGLSRGAAAGRGGPAAGQPARDHLRQRADRQPGLAGRHRDAHPSCGGQWTRWARPSSWSPTTR